MIINLHCQYWDLKWFAYDRQREKNIHTAMSHEYITSDKVYFVKNPKHSLAFFL